MSWLPSTWATPWASWMCPASSNSAAKQGHGAVGHGGWDGEGDGSPPSVTTSLEERLTVEGFATSACRCLVTTTQIIMQLLQKSTQEPKRRWRRTGNSATVFQLISPVDLRESWKLSLRSFVWTLPPPPPLKRRDPKINGFSKAGGCSSINGHHWGELGSSTSTDPMS